MSKLSSAKKNIIMLAEWLKSDYALTDSIMSRRALTDTIDYGRSKIYQFGNSVVDEDNDLIISIRVIIEDRNPVKTNIK